MMKVTKPSDREIAMARTFDAPRELVFEAWTKPDMVKRWLGTAGWPMAACEIDLKVGGAFRYVWRNADGAEMGVGGVYREIVRPERIVHTELFDDDWTGGETLVTTTFVERDGRTTVTCTVLYASREVRDRVLESPMEAGMAETFANLAALLDSLLAA